MKYSTFYFLFSKFSIAILFSIFYFLFSGSAWAAVLYLEPDSGKYYQGDTFLVEVRVDAENECINVVKAELNFSQEVLEALDFSQGNSILTIWLEKPKIDFGKISFVGGIPAGFCGRLPGDPGKSNLLGKIVFRPKEIDRGPSSAKLEFLESSQVLLNDGFGTPAKLTLKPAIFTISPEKLEVPKQEWQEELSKDLIPPELFEIEIQQDPNIFEGKYFIVFSTTDKQTGISHYELQESRKQKIENRKWKRAESPYLLADQSLKSIIRVKAVDKAGNEKLAEYLPPKKPFPRWLIIVVLIGAGIICWIVRKKKIESRK